MKRFLLIALIIFSVASIASAEPRSKRRAKSQKQEQTQTQAQTQSTPVQQVVETPTSQSAPQSAQPSVAQGTTPAPEQAQVQPQAVEKVEPKVEEKVEVKAEPAKQGHLPQVKICDSLKKSPIKPIKALDKSKIIDTLPTADKNLSVVLFNDNTWRYVQTGNIKADSTVFSKYWSETYLFPYLSVPLSSIPETTPIQLVDSLRAYHYPYKGYMTSRFGPRNGRRHAGVDLSLRLGDTIRAVFNGKVRYSQYHENGYGELIVIRHDNGLETYSAHLSKRLVKSGERVVAGQVIGLGGSTGRSSGPHLHFEFRYMGQSFDPERIIDFKTGNLRRDFILLKRAYFDVNSKYEQDFNSTVVVKPATTTTTTTAKPTTTKSTTTTKSAAKPVAKPKPAPQPVYYEVKSGDCLGIIAQKHKTTIKELCRLNKIKEEDQDKIKIGQKLRVK